jgi:hypothetical protein
MRGAFGQLQRIWSSTLTLLQLGRRELEGGRSVAEGYRSESVSRVLCPLRAAIIPLGHRLLTGSCDHTRGLKSGPLSLLFGLAPDGVWHARTITRAPVGSYPAISPLPLRAVYFLCHFPRIAPRRR